MGTPNQASCSLFESKKQHDCSFLVNRRFILKGLGAGLFLPFGLAQANAIEFEEIETDDQQIMPSLGIMKITIFSPSGVVINRKRFQSASKQLELLGAQVKVDASAAERFYGFAGTDEERLDAIKRVIADDSDIALAARGGYGLNRLLDRIDWRAVALSVDSGKRWCGHSDFTAFNLALLAHTGASSWASPMAVTDFSLIDAQGKKINHLDAATTSGFMEVMRSHSREIAFQTDTGFDGLDLRATLWGGNLTVLTSLLATPHMPIIHDGILFLEDVNERPYRIERMLLQLHQAGVLEQQKAILLGDFSNWPSLAVDRNYKLSDVVAYLRSVCRTPLLTGLPFGHTLTKVTLPVGLKSHLVVDKRSVQLSW